MAPAATGSNLAAGATSAGAGVPDDLAMVRYVAGSAANLPLQPALQKLNPLTLMLQRVQ